MQKLFNSFKPKKYDLLLAIDYKNNTFRGQVEISGHKTGRPSQRLTLHQKDLKIIKSEILDSKGEAISVDRINHHRRYDEVRFHTTNKLHAGTYKIVANFEGKITSTMHGMYPAFFTHNGKRKKIIATQFESHHAREVFPCIDEPEAKAVFSLTVEIDSGLEVLSNSLVKAESMSKGLRKVSFNDTPVMSTYLLALVCGPLHSVEEKSKSGVIVRSWASIATPKKQLIYSAQEAAKLLDFYEDYFGLKYPLPKCDQVALPDFDSGAMENWGLITYREIALLSDPDNRSISNEQYVSMVIAHELAHQWFGNLVTMRWWDDLWLNESFASLLEHIALDKIHPDWRQWEHYMATDVLTATSKDVYSNVQPIHCNVDDPELIDTMFDPSILYTKGGRVLKMLHDYIGEQDFREGLNSYFKTFAYKNADRNDLWHAFSQQSGKNIEVLLSPWIHQAGMPSLTVEKNGSQYIISQEKFTIDQNQDSKHVTWPIPLLTMPSIEPLVLDKHQETINSQEKLVFNAEGFGHFITKYSESSEPEVNRKNFTKFSTSYHMNRINDSLLLAKRGDTSLVKALELAMLATGSKRQTLWAMINRVLATSSQLTEGNAPAEINIRLVKSKIATPSFKEIGVQETINEDLNTTQLRSVLLGLLVSGDDIEVLQTLSSLYENRKINDLPSENRAVIISALVKTQPKLVSNVVSYYKSATQEVQTDILAGLATIRDTKELERIIDEALGPKGFVRDQDVIRWLAYMLRNRWSRQSIWQFIETNWEWLTKVFSSSKSFDYLPTYAAAVVTTKKELDQYNNFFSSKLDIKVLRRNILIGQADAQARVAWRKRDETKISNWLSDYSRS
jgi:aminopeptidase N